jgi:hypothetical protein
MTAEISAAETERHSRRLRLAGQLWERTRRGVPCQSP